MSRFAKYLYVVGAALAIIGSFLPWWLDGDLISYLRSGLLMRLDPIFFFQDQGGLLIVVLSIVTLALALWPPSSFKYQTFSALISAVCLVLVVTCQWALFAIRMLPAAVPGASGPLLGLDMIAMGAILVLVAAIANYRSPLKTASVIGK